jgi:hypothetical protein
LAYHLYPQLIPPFCNRERFGPPRSVTFASPWPWVAHLVSCLIPATSAPKGHALFRLAFATAPAVTALTWPQRLTRRLILQKARRHTLRFKSAIVLRPLVGIRFQVLFHSPNRGSFHLSLTVLVHYRSSRVFSLGRWTSQLPTGLACPVVLKVIGGSLDPFCLQGYHLLWLDLSSILQLGTRFVTP